MELIIFYENNGEIPKQFYRVLSFFVYSLIDNILYWLSADCGLH